MSKVNRIFDSNINRISEGLRVLEDISRFILDLRTVTEELREARHQIRSIFSDRDWELIQARDSQNDIGKKISQEDQISQKSLQQLVTSNFKRVQEGLRSIEECLKNTEKRSDKYKIEELRFSTYTMEKKLSSLLQRPVLPSGIYGLTAEKYSQGRDNITVVKDMAAGGVNIIQYREKHNQKSFREMYQECSQIREITKKHDILFLVNDYIQLAEAVDADGIHIGQDDLPFEEARELLSDDKIIGLSTHSPQQAQEAVEKGADYIGVGPVFPTDTKEDVSEAVGLDYVEWVEQNIDIPYVTIGGIKEHNIKQVQEKGANTFAMVTEIVGADDIAEQVRRLRKKLKE